MLLFSLCVQASGTACEGWVKIPKPGGVRKGWQQAWLAVSDALISFHECPRRSKKV